MRTRVCRVAPLYRQQPEPAVRSGERGVQGERLGERGGGRFLVNRALGPALLKGGPVGLFPLPHGAFQGQCLGILRHPAVRLALPVIEFGLVAQAGPCRTSSPSTSQRQGPRGNCSLPRRTP